MGTVLVTGGAGSMGRLVCARLAADGHVVRAFDLASANFDGLPDGVSALPGDLTSASDVNSAVEGVDAVVHLAAILPPTADQLIELAQKVNVEGTQIIVDTIKANSPNARLVFSSSVSVYGTPANDAEISTSQPYDPDDNYAKTKAESEQIVVNAGLDSCVLRISGVSIPVFQEPPEAWPFLPDQKIEFVHRDDAVNAIVAGVTAELTDTNRIVNVSGGPTWRMTGSKYVSDYFGMIEVDPADAIYQEEPGHFSWYSDKGGNTALGYQQNSYPQYLEQLQDDIDRLMEE
ncbi:MAG: NAD(P)-dependent oxidoreductase [Chloroflexi bacterium]|nr:NAD(P)-dependent oxidoreductase [Chloroflexota bacterium]MBT5627932.1 NAD(P)-dependent oxidoreductase [Chloroflexota bacterium]